jgi:hypothetical protein
MIGRLADGTGTKGRRGEAAFVRVIDSILRTIRSADRLIEAMDDATVPGTASWMPSEEDSLVTAIEDLRRPGTEQ